MKKLMTYEHLDSGKRIQVEFSLTEEDGHWVARMTYRDGGMNEVKAPTFYGTTQDQAERQLRKVFDKDKVTMFEMNKHLARHLK